MQTLELPAEDHQAAHAAKEIWSVQKTGENSGMTKAAWVDELTKLGELKQVRTHDRSPRPPNTHLNNNELALNMRPTIGRGVVCHSHQSGALSAAEFDRCKAIVLQKAGLHRVADSAVARTSEGIELEKLRYAALQCNLSTI